MLYPLSYGGEEAILNPKVTLGSDLTEQHQMITVPFLTKAAAQRTRGDGTPWPS